MGVLLAQSRPDEALEWCRRAVTLRPGETKYSYTLAYFLAARGQRDGAIQVLEEARAKGPSTPDAFALLGRLYLDQNKTAQALEVFRAAAADSRFPDAIRQQFAAQLQTLSTN